MADLPSTGIIVANGDWDVPTPTNKFALELSGSFGGGTVEVNTTNDDPFTDGAGDPVTFATGGGVELRTGYTKIRLTVSGATAPAIKILVSDTR